HSRSQNGLVTRHRRPIVVRGGPGLAVVANYRDCAGLETTRNEHGLRVDDDRVAGGWGIGNRGCQVDGCGHRVDAAAIAAHGRRLRCRAEDLADERYPGVTDPKDRAYISSRKGIHGAIDALRASDGE